MTKFFVYVTKREGQHNDYEFVEEAALGDFAQHEYDIDTMSFSGIAIEARDFDRAMQTWSNPSSQLGEYLMVDEPNVTHMRRTMLVASQEIDASAEAMRVQMEHTRVVLMMMRVAAMLHEANRLMNETAEYVYKLGESPSHTDPAKVFEVISKSVLDRTIKYNGESTLS